jgi:hypothetical protein
LCIVDYDEGDDSYGKSYEEELGASPATGRNELKFFNGISGD